MADLLPNKSQLNSDNTIRVVPAFSVRILALCFVTLKLKEVENTMCNINLFYMLKASDAIAGKFKNATHLRNIMLYCRNPEL
jgi:hypothetical protein